MLVKDKKVDYMVEYTGWHGTTKKAKDSILQEGKFNITDSSKSKRVPNDLGDGIYFFADYIKSDPKKIAFGYAKKYKSKIIQRDNTSVACLKAKIEAKDEEVLDLDEPSIREYLMQLNERYSYEISRKFKSANNDGAKERGNQDGYLVNILIDNQRDLEIKVVTMATYTPLSNMPSVSNFPNCREICVRDNDSIEIIEE